MTKYLSGMILVAMLGMAGCSDPKRREPPPRVEDKAPTPALASNLAVPIDMETDAVRRIVERAIPRTLWTIDQHSSRCVKPKQVRLLGVGVKVTPPISCTIIGEVTRGPVRLRGQGADIIADVPIRAQISARDIGGLLKGETATGSAMAHARIRLDLDPNWNPRGTVRLSYGWTTPPGIDFLGQRITFTQKADEKLAPILRKLEADLPRELAKANVRGQVDRLWRQGFTSVELNQQNPPVWMRITPQKLRFGGYRMAGPRIRLSLGLDALTETFVGQRPTDPAVTPLPPLERAAAGDRLRFFIPVIADYAQLEPVILRALTKRSQRPFVLPAVGNVTARFDKVVAYATTDNRIAVGVTLAIRPEAASIADTQGTIWLVARPVNAAGSARVAFTDLSVRGQTDAVANDLLLQLGNSPVVSQEIAAALTQNFTNDLSKLLEKIKRAVAQKQTGDFVIRAAIDQFKIGEIKAFGQGLYLPVDVSGKAEIGYRPERR